MRSCLALLIATLACCAGPALALDCPSVTRVGLSDLGYASFQTGGVVKGMSVDIINEMSRRSGCKFEMIWFPRERMNVEYQQGHIDVIMGAVATPERDAGGRFVPYGFTRFDLILSKRAAGSYASLAEFVRDSTARLNVIRGVPYPPAISAELERLGKAGRLELVTDFDVAFKKIKLERAGGTIATPTIYLWHLERLGEAATGMVALPLPESPRQFVGMYLSNRTLPAGAVALYAGALKRIVDDGTLERIYGHYFDAANLKRLFPAGVREIVNAIPAD
jgi:polar amino acid transport system substrate-binding protein